MERENWTSRLGFMLAAMGSAVGLGNIWRFSYVAGENGGGAFLVLYLACILLLGVPLLLAEISIGRKAQQDVVGSYAKLAPGRPWYLAGFLAVVGSILILGFYSVIAGWSLFYFWNYLNGSFFLEPAGGYGEAFGAFTSSVGPPLFWHSLFMAGTIAIVLGGVKRGIELANKIFMPALAVLLIILALFSISLDGAVEGLRFLFQPDWSVLSKPSVYLAAMGQAFFSLSLGVGVMMTYGSYLSKNDKLPGATVGIGMMDTFFAIISGVVIFPAVFAFGIEPASGPVLVFITLPDIFMQIPLGGFLGILFFLSLSLAAVSSSVSLLEVSVAYLMRALTWSRKKATVVIGIVIYILGIGASLGMGAWSGISFVRGLNIMDSMDYLASNIFLPLGGLAAALFLGWYFSRQEALDAADMEDSSLAGLWYTIVRYIAPIVILLIFLSALELI